MLLRHTTFWEICVVRVSYLAFTPLTSTWNDLVGLPRTCFRQLFAPGGISQQLARSTVPTGIVSSSLLNLENRRYWFTHKSDGGTFQ